jgi:hypothetical protein
MATAPSPARLPPRVRTSYETRGNLTGPNGISLAVRVIWMTEHWSGVTKFVTLLPDKRKTR